MVRNRSLMASDIRELMESNRELMKDIAGRQEKQMDKITESMSKITEAIQTVNHNSTTMAEVLKEIKDIHQADHAKPNGSNKQMLEILKYAVIALAGIAAGKVFLQ